MNESARLPTRPPRRNHETVEFWDGCAAGRLLLPRCDECASYIWYPRLVCPFCGSQSVTYHEVSGRGSVYSYSIIRRGHGLFRDVAPYVLAMVQLAEGPTLMTNLVDVDPETVSVDQRVHVVFEPVEGSTDAIYRFAPDH